MEGYAFQLCGPDCVFDLPFQVVERLVRAFSREDILTTLRVMERKASITVWLNGIMDLSPFF